MSYNCSCQLYLNKAEENALSERKKSKINKLTFFKKLAKDIKYKVNRIQEIRVQNKQNRKQKNYRKLIRLKFDSEKIKKIDKALARN